MGRKIFLTILVAFLLKTVFSSPVFAQVNIVERYDGTTISNIISNFGSNALVVITGDPENQTFIQVINANSFRWVVRGHQAWKNGPGQIGYQMLNEPVEAARRWGAFFSQITREIYFEPWNEPEHPEECGNLPVAQCADRIVAFLEALGPYLATNPHVHLITPAFDTLHPNHNALISALLARNFFSRFNFEAVSYHIYGTDNINSYQTNLSQWGISGMPIIITESGAMRNGYVIYTPAELCRFYEQAVSAWQGNSQIRGWALFSFDPTGSYPRWDLFAPEARCVVDALQGNFHCEDCGQTPEERLQSPLGRAALCPPIPLVREEPCPQFYNNVDCYYAPDLQQACNLPVSLPEFGARCEYDLNTQVTVNNPQTNCDETGCHEVINGQYQGSLPPMDQSTVPVSLANLFFSLAKRPSSNIPLNESVVNGFDLGSSNRAITGRVMGARRDAVMLQAVMAHYNESHGADFIIGCGFVPPGGRVDAVPVTTAAASCSDDYRPIYASEIACMNQTQTYKAITQGLNIEFLPFPTEVIEMCDRLYGADRFETGRISPSSLYVQQHPFSGEILGILPHLTNNVLWERLPAYAASSLGFTTTIQGGEARSEQGDLGYGGGVVDLSGFGNDRENRRTDFSLANFFLPQRRLDELSEQLSQPVNKCEDRVREDYIATSTVRIRNILEIIIDLINQAIDFIASRDADGNLTYQNSQQVNATARANLDYPGFSPSFEKFNNMYFQIIPEREVRSLREANDPALRLRGQSNEEETGLVLPVVQKGQNIAETAHQWLWPENWKQGEF